MYKYSAAELTLAAEQASSIAQMLRLPGLKSSGGRRASIRTALCNYGIDTNHFCHIAWTKYSTELLAEAARASQSVNQVLDYLGIPRRGGAHTHISRRLKNAGIDTSHFSRNTGVRERPCEQFGRDTLAEAAKDSASMRQILGRLGFLSTGELVRTLGASLEHTLSPNRLATGAWNSMSQPCDLQLLRHTQLRRYSGSSACL